ncbi:MAG: NAD(P)H-binding protein [Cuspidothrix sp.]|uniref:NAD(P)-binding domain-containing protein n=1 Tax=Cuspidothrix issatschenkoi CHARLIE-1 TaxID=2052836 RepID=A0A2S6CWB0_9CYAN|nr:NAD(P)H-binding protein [Cuspidothrix issatschenkoi]PPJ64048.1 hypothetical protein CUN59_06755 [Cuspidothrix issatschenkoi CHARLIE-1]
MYGGNGFTASHLVKTLENQGHTIKYLVRKTSDLSRLNNRNIELIYGEITDSLQQWFVIALG